MNEVTSSGPFGRFKPIATPSYSQPRGLAREETSALATTNQTMALASGSRKAQALHSVLSLAP